MAVPKSSRSKSLVKLNKINGLKKDFLNLNKIGFNLHNLHKKKLFKKNIILIA